MLTAAPTYPIRAPRGAIIQPLETEPFCRISACPAIGDSIRRIRCSPGIGVRAGDRRLGLGWSNMGSSVSHSHTRYDHCSFPSRLLLPELTPNPGLWWYFFTEMFDYFRPFFLMAFSVRQPVSLSVSVDSYVMLILMSRRCT